MFRKDIIMGLKSEHETELSQTLIGNREFASTGDVLAILRS